MVVGAAIPIEAAASSQDPMPKDVVMAAGFRPGSGRPVGTVGSVAGEAVIIHQKEKKGYRAQQDLPIFQGDTIITRQQGRIRLNLNDGSSFTMIPGSKIVIDKSIYDPDRQERKTVLGLDVGKVRFMVNKLLDFKSSPFEVETPTAILGVRGSDFVGDVTPENTTATAFENTRLEVGSRKAKGEPVLLRDFERSRVEKNKAPTPAEKVPHDEIERLKKEFVFVPDGGAAKTVRTSVPASALTSAQNCDQTRASEYKPGSAAAARLLDWARKGGN